MDEPLSPRFKTFLYNCYKRESQNNPSVSLQSVYTMAIEKYKQDSASYPSRQKVQVQSIIDTKSTNAFTNTKKIEKMCDISLELIANHKKHRKKF